MPLLDQLIAHRGWQKYYPENTLLSIQKAVDNGAKHIECDVLLSRDGVFFLVHDDNLLRLSGIDKNIADVAAAELCQMPCYEPKRLGEKFINEKFAALTSLLEIAQKNTDVTFYIELKQGAIDSHGLEYCLTLLSSLFNGVSNIVLISFSQQTIAQAKTYGINNTGIVLTEWQTQDKVIEQCGCDIAFIDQKILPDEIINSAVPIAVYEVTSKEQANKLLKQGVSLLESFDIFGLTGGEVK